ncbi:unnamed protein product [Thlaspi arvense]|uniref:Uncharacterized protein n=1 Tax=Thlaspi arvense TaxID=13288 RepID=A0AAU9RMK4_THLAR|nr:unnamed protein product [Thlaspi arvense]
MPIWAGYGILEFRLSKDKRSIFSEIRRNPPEPKRTIDLLGLLTQRFGSRAGDMKLETLAAYFGLGNQTHESGLCQDECRGSQESSHLNELVENSITTSETSSRRRRNISTSPLQSFAYRKTGENSTSKRLLSFVSLKEAQMNLFDMRTLRNEIAPKVVQSDYQSETVASEGFLDIDEISIPSIRATHVPLYDERKIMKLQLFLGDRPLRLHCPCLVVRFGINGKFRIMLGDRTTYFYEDVDRYAVEIHQGEFSGVTQRLISRNPNTDELKAMVSKGTVLEAFLSIEPYDYQQRAGIRLNIKEECTMDLLGSLMV